MKTGAMPEIRLIRYYALKSAILTKGVAVL
jgi:hypothetical protein